MDAFLTGTDTKKIYKAIHKKYKKVAKNPTGLFKYPTGRAGLEALQYPSEIINTLPEAVTDSYCGVGNPFALGPINQGELVPLRGRRNTGKGFPGNARKGRLYEC